MRTAITIFDRETGRVLSIRRVDMGREPIILAPEQDWIEGALEPSRCYVDPVTREPVEKPDMAITIEGNVLSGIPVGTTAIVNLAKHDEPIDDGVFEIEVDHPQLVHVTLQHPFHRAWEAEVACEPDEG